MTRNGSRQIERDSESGARAAERLANERIGWLTTVASDGMPQTSPIWFLWDGVEILIYSLESPRARNVAVRGRVSMHLDGNGLGGDIVIVEGVARIDESTPSAAENAAYVAKYGPVMDDHGWTPEWFAGRYSVPIRITPTRFRYW
jgi:PPOX class probable F420-dependent enzyme